MSVEIKNKGDVREVKVITTPDEASDTISINLNWNRTPGGFWKMFSHATDLDLGCFIELADGTLWCIDGLQFANGLGGDRDELTRQGRFTDSPYVWHNGDNRGDINDEGETISINSEGLSHIKRMLIYTFIYKGATNWAQTKAVVTIDVPGSEMVEIKLGQEHSQLRMCAIADLTFDNVESVNVRKLVKFFNGHRDMAAEYNWKFNFTSGKK